MSILNYNWLVNKSPWTPLNGNNALFIGILAFCCSHVFTYSCILVFCCRSVVFVSSFVVASEDVLVEVTKVVDDDTT
jgi:hypothetical protein